MIDRNSQAIDEPGPNVAEHLRVAIVHYWFVNHRGGEKVVDAFLEMYPQADVFTHVIDRDKFSGLAARHSVTETWIASIPGARRHYQKLLPLMPLALEQLDLRGYDLVISSESGPAKGVLTDPDTLHLCYCHSPMRYLWDMYPEYRAATGTVTKLMMVPLTHYLRIWDFVSAGRVDVFVANSAFVARRIAKTFKREAEVVHPPVALQPDENAPKRSDDFLMLGQLTRYKRPDLVVEAFRRMPQRRLTIIGEGEMLASLQRDRPDNVRFLGRADDETVRRYLSSVQALIFPGVEDFGMVPVEAMACGTPVIAFARGGVTESVVAHETGLFFETQSADALIDALQRFDAWAPQIDRARIRARAENFSVPRFKARIQHIIDRERGRTSD